MAFSPTSPVMIRVVDTRLAADTARISCVLLEGDISHDCTRHSSVVEVAVPRCRKANDPENRVLRVVRDSSGCPTGTVIVERRSAGEQAHPAMGIESCLRQIPHGAKSLQRWLLVHVATNLSVLLHEKRTRHRGRKPRSAFGQFDGEQLPDHDTARHRAPPPWPDRAHRRAESGGMLGAWCGRSARSATPATNANMGEDVELWAGELWSIDVRPCSPATRPSPTSHSAP
jgi:hypothetical protein